MKCDNTGDDKDEELFGQAVLIFCVDGESERTCLHWPILSSDYGQKM